MKIKDFLFWGLMAILVVLLIAAMAGSMYFWYRTWNVKDTAVLTHPNGNQYLCEFYRNGEMSCDPLEEMWVTGEEEP